MAITDHCECDNTHLNNGTVCQFCYEQGARVCQTCHCQYRIDTGTEEHCTICEKEISEKIKQMEGH